MTFECQIEKVTSITGPQTFKHLDLTWKPMLKMVLQKTDGSGEYSPLVFSLKEKQGKRDHGKLNFCKSIGSQSSHVLYILQRHELRL